MTNGVPHNDYCPVCGEINTDHPQFCSFCKCSLYSDWVVGALKFEQEQVNRQELENHKREFCHAAMVVSWLNGSFNTILFDTLTENRYLDGYKEQKSRFEEDYQNNFRTLAQNDGGPLQQGIRALAMGQQDDLFVLDDGPDQITLAHISRVGNQLNARFSVINWNSLLKDLPEDLSRRNLALVGGYVELEKRELSKLIRSGFSELGAPQSFSVLICSRLYDGKHSLAIREAVEEVGCQIYSNPYLINSLADFKAYLESWLARAPLNQELALVTARVAPDGNVMLQYHTLFQAGIFLNVTQSKQVTLRSVNPEGSQIDLAVVIRHQEKRDQTLKQAWKANLSYGQEAHLTFRLTNRGNVEILGVPVTPYSPSLRNLLASVPSSISVKTPALDLVLVIDTVASPETLHQRCKMAKDTLHALTDQREGDIFRFVIIAYGDHYPIGRNDPKGWPFPVRMLKYKNLQEIENFLDDLTTTPIEVCDFESALDEALHKISLEEWRENAYHWVLTLGQRPPHPKRKLPGSYQVGSRLGLDWKDLVRNIREQGKANSLAIVCPLEWPGVVPPYAQSYAEEFWSVFGYTECIEFAKIDATKLAHKIWNYTIKTENGLCLPVLVE